MCGIMTLIGNGTTRTNAGDAAFIARALENITRARGMSQVARDQVDLHVHLRYDKHNRTGAVLKITIDSILGSALPE